MPYWTDDINDEFVLSPLEIMQEVADELERRTKRLRVEILDVALEDRMVLRFQVENPAFGRRFNLFDIYHRKIDSYPAVINPPSDDVPDFLRRERIIKGSAAGSISLFMDAIKHGASDRIEENEWVCATPTELKAKLSEMLAQENVRSIIISLLASSRDVSHDKDENTVDGGSN